eukprot:scaffold3428_cov379-Prasinococcus_capsulatus_cf.AAC.25
MFAVSAPVSARLSSSQTAHLSRGARSCSRVASKAARRAVVKCEAADTSTGAFGLGRGHVLRTPWLLEASPAACWLAGHEALGR